MGDDVDVKIGLGGEEREKIAQIGDTAACPRMHRIDQNSAAPARHYADSRSAREAKGTTRASYPAAIRSSVYGRRKDEIAAASSGGGAAMKASDASIAA